MGREVGSWMRDVWQDAREFRHCRKASSRRDARWWGDHTCTMARRSIYTDGTHGVGAGNGVKGGGSLLSRSFLLFTLSTVRYRARRPRCGNQQLESRVRENRQHGSEGGEAKAFPTPITDVSESSPHLTDSRDYSARSSHTVMPGSSSGVGAKGSTRRRKLFRSWSP